MPTPEVISGYRGPRSEQRSDRVPGQSVLNVPEGKRRFSADGLKYRLQLTNPRPQALPDGRWLDPEKAKVVVFEDGMLELDVVKDAAVIEMIEAHPYYNRDFRDVAPLLLRAEQARKDNAANTILSLPLEDRRKILEALQASTSDDFDVKPRQAAATQEASGGA